jgi:hypothetical protein
MIENNKIEFNQLFVGFEFPSKSYTLDSTLISLYLDAVKDDNDLFRHENLVPPMAITAYAMASLSEFIKMPPGTIHVTQELDFIGLVRVGDTITCFSKVSRKQDRGGLHIMNIDIWVTNQNQDKVLTGKVGFILPEPKSSDVIQ